MHRSNQPNRKVTGDDSDYNYEGTSSDDDDDDDYEYYATPKPKNASIPPETFPDQSANTFLSYQQVPQSTRHLPQKHKTKIPKSKQKQFHLSHRKPRRLFTPEEDRLLLSLVEQLGVNSWIEISEKIPGRSSRQCKERYVTYLCPNVNHSPWTDEEDLLLVQKVNEMGKRWSDISKFFNGRTANAIKNRYHLHLRGHYSETRNKHRNQIQNQIHQQFQRHLLKRSKEASSQLQPPNQPQFPQTSLQPNFQVPNVQSPLQTTTSLQAPVIYTAPSAINITSSIPRAPLNNTGRIVMIPAFEPKPIPVQNIQYTSFVNYQPPMGTQFSTFQPINSPDIVNPIGLVPQAPTSVPSLPPYPQSFGAFCNEHENVAESSDIDTNGVQKTDTNSNYNISNLLVNMMEKAQDEPKVVATKSKILLPPLRLCFPL